MVLNFNSEFNSRPEQFKAATTKTGQSKPEQFKAAFILWTVELIRVLTVATDSIFNCFEERLATNIWKATVTSEPPDLPVFSLVEAPALPVSGWPSLEITNPDGSIGMFEESSPLMAMFMAGMSIGA